ncbi:MAG: homoserine dehydrogenase [Clostridia bacterium]|nr:homoserine dehydrogenase [Clostridia bacterium]
MTDIALLGFGTVGSGVAEIIMKNQGIREDRGVDDINIKYILDLRDFPEHPLGNKVVHDFNVILSDPDVKIVVEMMGGLRPAYDFILASLKAGKCAVTSNKAVVAEYGPELLSVARENGVFFLFEASTGGCIPLIGPLSEQSKIDRITGIYGIINGTTNYILDEMEREGVSFDEALKRAVSKGYAEADPSADIGGFDTCRKICILAATAFGKLVDFKSVRTIGIDGISNEIVETGRKLGCETKLIGAAEINDGEIHITCEPMYVKKSCPLSYVSGVYNAVLVKGDASGELLFYGKGAGSLPTANAVVGDIIKIIENRASNDSWDKLDAVHPSSDLSFDQVTPVFKK